MEDIVDLSRRWLKHKRKGSIEGIEILPHQSLQGLVVYFYFEDTLEDLPYFLTVPMVNELLNGASPRKVINKFIV